MHWENVEPLLVAALLAIASAIWLARRISGHKLRRYRQRERDYARREMTWRNRIKAYGFLNRFHAPRLTDQREQAD